MRHKAIRFRRSLNEDPDINLIPLIDVLLVILIFLVVSTTYTKYSQLKVVVPSAQGDNSTEMKRNEVLISISSSGQYAVAGGTMETRDLNNLAQALQSEITKLDTETSPVVLLINADAMAPHQTVINALEAARRVGIEKVSYLTKR